MATFLFAAIFVANFGAILYFMWRMFSSHAALFTYMEQQHPALWQAAGEPRVAQVGPLKLSTPMPEFLTRRQYRQHADPQLQALGDAAFRWTVIGIPYFFLSVLALILLSGVLASLGLIDRS